MAEPRVDHAAIAALEDRHSSGGVTRRPVTITRAIGARMWDANGNEYVDCAAAHGWAALGHGHPEVNEAIATQLRSIATLTESSYNDQRARWFGALAELFASTLGTTARGAITRIHPCNSGTEAVEAALKFARVATGRTDFVAAHRGFHGRTLGALSATGTSGYRTPFEPLLPGFQHVTFNDAAALESAITDQTAGVILEVVQGEGGVHLADWDYLRTARQLCDEQGALLIIDEIQTGLGRTGQWFACEHLGVAPDIIVLGKALGGGIPMGAACWREGLGTFASGAHGSTFGGNPLACAASLAVLHVLTRDRLPERATLLGAGVLAELHAAQAKCVREVRGLGLMIGVELRQRVTPVLQELLKRGVWALPAGPNVLRLLPPLTISEDDLERAIGTIVDVLRAS